MEEEMFGLGIPEFIVLILVLAPIVFITYMLVKSERKITREKEELSSEIKAIIRRLTEF